MTRSLIFSRAEIQKNCFFGFQEEIKTKKTSALDVQMKVHRSGVGKYIPNVSRYIDIYRYLYIYAVCCIGRVEIQIEI